MKFSRQIYHYYKVKNFELVSSQGWTESLNFGSRRTVSTADFLDLKNQNLNNILDQMIHHQMQMILPNLNDIQNRPMVIGHRFVLELVPILFYFWRHHSASSADIFALADMAAALLFDLSQFWHHSDLDMKLHHLDLGNILLDCNCNNFYCLKYDLWFSISVTFLFPKNGFFFIESDCKIAFIVNVIYSGSRPLKFFWFSFQLLCLVISNVSEIQNWLVGQVFRDHNHSKPRFKGYIRSKSRFLVRIWCGNRLFWVETPNFSDWVWVDKKNLGLKRAQIII